MPPISIPMAPTPDYLHQGAALRTLMQFVELEPSLCVSTAPKVGLPAAATARVGSGALANEQGARAARGPVGAGGGTVWGGLFFEVVRALALGPCSMQLKVLKALGEDYVNVHDDIRYAWHVHGV